MARSLFVTKGYRETTLEEVARRAEFGKGTLYNYFANKEDLFIGIIDQTVDDFVKIVRESMEAPGSLRDKLRRYAESVIRHVDRNGEVLHLVHHEFNRSDAPRANARLRGCLRRGLETRKVLAESLANASRKRTIRKIDPVKLAILFESTVRGYCIHRFSIERAADGGEIPGMADLITDIFLNGIAVRQDEG